MPEKCTESCAELEQLKSTVKELQEHSSDTHREIFTRLRKLEQSDAVREVQYTAILDKLNVLDKKIDALEAKPGKRWESIVDKVIWAVCAAVIAFLLARIGL